MRKMILAFVSVLAISITLLSWKAAIVKNNAAAVINGFDCVIPDGDGGFVITDASKTVITSSGNENFKCSASGVPNSQGKAVVIKDFGCVSNLSGSFKFTEQTHATISASGQATMTCKFR